jgi:hypothetical protein
MFLRIRKSAAAVRRWEPTNTRYRFYICQSERQGTRVTRRDLAYAGAITDKDMKALRNVERVYRDIESALAKLGTTDVDRSKIIANMAEWCPRPNADALAAEARQREAEYDEFYQRMGKTKQIHGMPFKFWSET